MNRSAHIHTHHTSPPPTNPIQSTCNSLIHSIQLKLKLNTNIKMKWQTPNWNILVGEVLVCHYSICTWRWKVHGVSSIFKPHFIKFYETISPLKTEKWSSSSWEEASSQIVSERVSEWLVHQEGQAHTRDVFSFHHEITSTFALPAFHAFYSSCLVVRESGVDWATMWCDDQ